MPTHPYLTQIVHRAARTRPGRPCLIYRSRTSTNAEFADRVSRLAGALLALGVRAGERISICARNSDRYVETMFAALWAGAAANPLNLRWNAAEIAYAIGDCEASALFVDETTVGLVDDLRAAAPALRHIVYLGDGPTPPGLTSYEDLVARGPAVADAGCSGDDLAFVLYTGGTTGSPKGVMISHANLLAASTAMLAAGCGTGETYLHAPPLFHIAGIQVMTGHFLGGGGAHVIVPGFDPVAIMEAVERHRVTDVMLVPTMLQMVLSHPLRGNYDLTSVRRVFYGAAPMTEPLLRAAMEAIPEAGFIQGYGMTETALTVMLPARFHTAEGRRQGKLTSIGVPLCSADVAIRDPDGTEVARGVVGELTVKSASVMLGYIGRPAETAKTVREGWLYSGDGAYMDADGFVFLVDRIKDMIIMGGENVYSIEVESVLTAHPDVAACAVIGVPHDQWGEQVHAVVVSAPGAQASGAQLEAHCRERLSAFKCPRSFEFVDALPVSAAGKILKTELRARHKGGVASQ